MKEHLLQFSYNKLLPSVPFDKLKVEIEPLEVQRFFSTCKPIRCIMYYWGNEEVEQGILKLTDNQLILSDNTFYCDVFKEFSSCQITSGMAYLISCSQDSYEQIGSGELNYHFIQNSCIDLVRDIVMQNFKLFTKNEYDEAEQIAYTKGFGPGYFGMPVEEGKKIHKLLHGEQIGVRYKGDMMYPLKSSIGLAFSYKGKNEVCLNPCDYCEATGEHCMFCGGL